MDLWRLASPFFPGFWSYDKKSTYRNENDVYKHYPRICKSGVSLGAGPLDCLQRHRIEKAKMLDSENAEICVADPDFQSMSVPPSMRVWRAGLLGFRSFGFRVYWLHAGTRISHRQKLSRIEHFHHPKSADRSRCTSLQTGRITPDP